MEGTELLSSLKVEDENDDGGGQTDFLIPEGASSSTQILGSNSAGKWSLLQPGGADLPSSSGHSLLPIGTSLYMFGGQTDEGFSNRVYRLQVYPDLTVQLMQVRGVAPEARANHAAVAVGTEMYCIGGAADGHLLNDVFALQTGSNPTWRQVMPPEELFTPLEAAEELPRCCGHSVVELDDVLYVFGGQCGPAKFSSQLHALDLKRNRMRWHRLQAFGSGPSPRAGHTAALIGTKMFICGGSAGKQCGFVDLYCIDLAAPTVMWRRLKTFGDLPWVGLFSSSFAHLHAIYVSGVTPPHPLAKQIQEPAELYCETYVLRLSSNPLAWRRIPVGQPLPCARSGHSVALFDNCLYVVGGVVLEQTTPVNESWALQLNPEELSEDAKPAEWLTRRTSASIFSMDIDSPERYGVVRARKEKVPFDGVRFVVPIHGNVIQFLLELRPNKLLRIIYDGMVQCETEDVYSILRCAVNEDFTAECTYRRSWVRSGMAATVNGIPVEGSYTDPLNILKATKVPAQGLLVLLLIRTFYNFFTFQHLHFSVIYFAACIVLGFLIYWWDSHLRAAILLALAIGIADTAEAIWWLLGHFLFESDWLLGVQLLLLGARILLLVWVGKSLPLLSYL